MRAAAGLVDSIIRTRRSVRRYSPDPIPCEVVREILHVATHAPSPHNRQPWRFAVIRRAAPKARLAEAMGDRLRADRMRDGDPAEAVESDVARSRARLEGAPVVLVVALTMADMDRYADERRAGAEYIMAVQAAASAVQNVLLLAPARGIGACWMCAPLFCPEVVRACLRLPDDWQPQALVTLGRPAAPGRDRARLSTAITTQWVDD